jgi:glutamate carboxypeptidase
MPRFIATGLLAAIFAGLPASATAQLSSMERDVAAAVTERTPAALALLERVVNINSGTGDHDGVRAVGAIFRAQLDSLGFATRWEDGSSWGRAGHLIAEHPGAGPKLLLIGHLDTVFEDDSPFQRFERLDDSTARGPGIIDMKGGDVIIVEALRALHDVGQLDGMHVVVVMTGDEEDSGRPLALSKRALVEAAAGTAAAIGVENGAGDPATAVTVRRGATTWTLRTTGTAGHASQVFRADIGAGAIYEAARILATFHSELAGEEYLAFSPGLIAGGSDLELSPSLTEATVAGKTNVIAREVVVTGDMRTISPEQLGRTQQRMREIVARHLPHTGATITFADGYPPLAPSEGNERLREMYHRVSLDLGTGPVASVDPSRAGAADVAFVAGIAPMIMDGIGLSGTDDHSADETADLRRLPSQTARLAVLLHRLSRR